MTEIRTLIIDDDFAVARLHASFLDRIPGFVAVGSALTAAAALGRLREGGVDLLLLDLYLPDASGLELLRRIRSDVNLDVDVVMVSAAGEPELVEQAISLGVADFLLKPFSREEFQARLDAFAVKWRSREEIRGVGRLSQLQIDRLLTRGSAVAPRATSKGLNPETRRRIMLGLGKQGHPATATEIAEVTGVSRVSARRYLEQLVHEGAIEMRPRYGETGRPQHEYWLSS